eukprot:363732-Chlamydomonas_euryale.AAC.12
MASMAATTERTCVGTQGPLPSSTSLPRRRGASYPTRCLCSPPMASMAAAPASVQRSPYEIHGKRRLMGSNTSRACAKARKHMTRQGMA